MNFACLSSSQTCEKCFKQAVSSPFDISCIGFEKLQTLFLLHTVLLKSKLPPLISFLATRVSFLSRRFSRAVSSFSQESLKRLVWDILCVRNQLHVTIVLQFIVKSLEPFNIKYVVKVKDDLWLKWLKTMSFRLAELQSLMGKMNDEKAMRKF